MLDNQEMHNRMEKIAKENLKKLNNKRKTQYNFEVMDLVLKNKQILINIIHFIQAHTKLLKNKIKSSP